MQTRSIGAKNLLDHAEDVQLLGLPDQCPLCGRGMQPKTLGATRVDEQSLVEVACQCPFEDCQRLFVGTFLLTGDNIEGRRGYYFADAQPRKVVPREFSDEVKGISETFVDVYHQVQEAAAAELDQVVGMGLRKALEYLIKDYVVAEHPGAEEAIKKTPLSACIRDYVTNDELKMCAERAVWLANDETHYHRKWEEKDVNDLKEVVEMTINWLQLVLRSKRLLQDMPEGR